MVGQSGVATTDIAPKGEVRVAGEKWTAVADTEETISEGDEVTVLETEGVILKVFKAPQPDALEENGSLAEEPA